MGQANHQHNQARGGIRSLTFYLAAQAEENKVLVLFTPNPNTQLPAARSVDAVAFVMFHTLTIRYFLTLGV
jgi:hypothetical protein